MPPISQPGSRAGLITGLVISVILCVVFISLTCYFKLERDKMDKDRQDALDRLAPVASDLDLSRPEMRDLLSQAKAKPTKPTLVNFLLQQRKDAVGISVSNPDELPEKARENAMAAITAAKTKAPGRKTIPDTTPLCDAIGMVATAGAEAEVARQAAVDELAKATATAAGLVQSHATELAAKDKSIQDFQQQALKAQSDATNMRVALTGDAQKISDRIAANEAAAQETQQKLLTEIQTRDATIGKLKEEIVKYQTYMAKGRGSPEDPIVRQIDGHILQFAGQNIVYIDIGNADHLMPGLTFEVYSKHEGVPKLGDGLSDTDLPAGKASIEVIRIDQNSAECRVTRTAVGQQIEVGDIIANLIWDRNVKPVFFVYGDFDTDRNGTYTAQEKDVIKKLITMWGGAVTDKLDMDVDFVIMGKEPVLPNFSAEELKDAVNQQKLDKARADLEAYDEMRQKSRDLHIPMMNQNRFLYFVGYFDRLKQETGH